MILFSYSYALFAMSEFSTISSHFLYKSPPQKKQNKQSNKQTKVRIVLSNQKERIVDACNDSDE